MGFVYIVKPGLQTTVQDLGRWGRQAHGVPVAGPMDSWSHRVANALVGNPTDAAAFEIAFIGPELEFEDDRIVAMSGAEFVVTIDDVQLPLNRPIPVSAGARLRFGARRCGARAYVAIGGGIATPVVFGSRATHLGSRMGGVDGRPIARGDRVPLGPARQTTRAVDRAGDLEDRVRPSFLKRISRHGNRLAARVRVLPGPQTALFARDAWGTLHSAVYSIASESDRMGYRLHGPALRYARQIDMISEATPLGSLQVPPGGQPILLMADRQTTGGYPKIATVITADSGIAGQLGPGDTIQFEEVNQAEALAALLVEERALMAIEALGAS